MKNVKPFKNPDARLSEIYTTGFQLAFTSEDNEMCHPWVLCKDFLNDVVWSLVHNKKAGIYSFRYSPKENPRACINPIKMIVRDKTQKPDAFDKRIRQSIKFLNIVERLQGFQQSTVEKVKFGETSDSVWMFTCSKEWVHAPPLLSLLTLYMRVGCNYPGGGRLNDALRYYKKEINHNDADYLKQSRKMRLLILKKGLSIFCEKMEDNWPNAEISTIHNQWGIVNCTGYKKFKELWDLKDLEIIGKKKEDESTKKS